MALLALSNNHSLTHLLILILRAMSCITVPELPLCLGVLKPRAPLTRGPIFLPKTMFL